MPCSVACRFYGQCGPVDRFSRAHHLDEKNINYKSKVLETVKTTVENFVRQAQQTEAINAQKKSTIVWFKELQKNVRKLVTFYKNTTDISGRTKCIARLPTFKMLVNLYAKTISGRQVQDSTPQIKQWNSLEEMIRHVTKMSMRKVEKEIRDSDAPTHNYGSRVFTAFRMKHPRYQDQPIRSWEWKPHVGHKDTKAIGNMVDGNMPSRLSKQDRDVRVKTEDDMCLKRNLTLQRNLKKTERLAREQRQLLKRVTKTCFVLRNFYRVHMRV